MADPQHLDLLMQGTDTWNTWRSNNPTVEPDLFGTDLFRANLCEANLSNTALAGTNLSGADLSNADLGGANLSNADLGGATLSGANLGGVNLQGTNFNQADLSYTCLFMANLCEADLRGARLTHADLMYANLNYAALQEANLKWTDLRKADLSEADLRLANLSEVNLSEANLSNTHMFSTFLGDLDLSSVKGLETVIHNGPSYLSINTLYLSHGNIPEVFVRGTGAPDSFIDYMRSLVTRPIEYYTCFISYCSKDQAIAQRLYTDLQQHGVRCWFGPHELKPGDYYREKIDESIRKYDKLVLILSQHSIKSKRVEEEVNSALKREESMDMTQQVLFPIRLDDAVIKSSRSWISSISYLRHIGDFTCWKDHDAYHTALQRLLSDLKKSSQ